VLTEAFTPHNCYTNIQNFTGCSSTVCNMRVSSKLGNKHKIPNLGKNFIKIHSVTFVTFWSHAANKMPRYYTGSGGVTCREDASNHRSQQVLSHTHQCRETTEQLGHDTNQTTLEQHRSLPLRITHTTQQHWLSH